jgi:hypothetical protein
MCQVLLTDTIVKVKLKEAIFEPFETTIGTPQGDGLHPILFAIYFERAFRDISEDLLPPRPPCDSGLPMQMILADDTYFPSKSKPYSKEQKLLC